MKLDGNRKGVAMTRGNFVKGVLMGAVVSTVVLAATAAFAGTGVGGIFNLGTANTVNNTSTLTGSTNGRQLQVTNTGTSASASGVGINVAPGNPPLVVNSSTQVKNLNASLLDGLDSSNFQRPADQPLPRARRSRTSARMARSLALHRRWFP